jgi:ABC-type amino acid transport system permease subunit
MKFLLFISNAFINTMGITHPSPRTANRAAWVIAAMLLGVILCVATFAIFGIRLAIRH